VDVDKLGFLLMQTSSAQDIQNGRPILALSMISFIWGYNWVVMKEGLRFCGPFDFAALRVFFACFCLLGILLWKRRDIAPRQVKLTVLVGLLSTTLGLGLPMWALVYGAAGKTAILLYTMPFWAMLLAWPILGERIQGLEWLAVVLAFTGLVLIIDFYAVGEKLWSSVVAVISGMAWAGSAIVTRIMRRSPDFDLVSVTTWQMLFGAVPLFIVAAFIPAPPVQWTGSFMAALAYNIFLTSVLAFLLWFYILQRLTAGVATMGMLAAPVIAVISAGAQLGEIPSLRESIGMALILSGISLLSFLAIVKSKPPQGR
jgi:drug/metabolite transporter (DMT)-like permease